jgi:sigma-B regulation protein RsbU (phosphoserine phosphatase)
LTEDLTTLNEIVETLNRSVDVRGALESTLDRLVKLMGLETGLIFLKRPEALHRGEDGEYLLAAHCNLPPALALDNTEAWAGRCECQRRCDRGELVSAYNVVHCSRLAAAKGDRRDLAVHASVPLRSGSRTLGILNVIGADQGAFSPRALALLTNVGNQMGVALERARLFDLLKEQRILEQATLLNLSNRLLGRLDLDDVISCVLTEARRLLAADACALLLLDEETDSLRFRAASGWLVEPPVDGRLLPADERSLGRAIDALRPLLLEDLEAREGGTWGCDLLRSEGFRGHAVVPLTVDGRATGALMVDQREPRLLDGDEVRLLQLMANQAAIAIETARLHQEELERHRMEQELMVARQIQLGLLPRDHPSIPGWEFALVYEPARQVGGDLYDFLDLPGGSQRLGIVAADVADKGVPAALMMALSRTVIRTATADGRGPGPALSLANSVIQKDSQAGLFVTAFYAMLDTASGRLVYANAGHNRPLWLRASSGDVEELAARGIALGVLDDVDLEEREIQLDRGDLVVFYTDGVTEAMNVHEEHFGEERLRTVVAASRGATAEHVLSTLLNAIRAFVGDAPQSDDLTLLVVRRCPGAD